MEIQEVMDEESNCEIVLTVELKGTMYVVVS